MRCLGAPFIVLLLSCGGSTPETPRAVARGVGTQWYVAPNGDDRNAGTAAAPWRTIQWALDHASPASTINVKAGVYAERLQVTASGTADQFFTLQPDGFSGAPGCGGSTGVACGGDAVVLDYASLGTVRDGVPFLKVDGQHHVRVQGLTFENYQVEGPGQKGVEIRGPSDHVDILNNRFLHNRNVGAYGPDQVLLHLYVWAPATNVTIRGNEIGDVVTAYSEALTVNGATATTIEANWIHDTDGIAVDLGPGSSGTAVRGNLLEWVGKQRDGSAWHANRANAVYVNGGADAVLERNTVRDSEWAFAVSAEPGIQASHDIAIRDNVAYRNYAGVAVGNWYSDVDGSVVHDVHVLNNTLYQNGTGFTVRPYVSETVTWQGNIVAGGRVAVSNTLGWPVGTMDYNLYGPPGPASPGPHELVADPRFVDPGRDPPDLTLAPGSPARRAGNPAFVPAAAEQTMAGVARASGPGDLGAY